MVYNIVPNSSGGIDKEGEEEYGGNGEKRRPNSTSENSGAEFVRIRKRKTIDPA